MLNLIINKRQIIICIDASFVVKDLTLVQPLVVIYQKHMQVKVSLTIIRKWLEKTESSVDFFIKRQLKNTTADKIYNQFQFKLSMKKQSKLSRNIK